MREWENLLPHFFINTNTMNIFELTRILNEMQSKVEQTKNTLDVYDEVEDD